jgi:hypothetical protein
MTANRDIDEILEDEALTASTASMRFRELSANLETR